MSGDSERDSPRQHPTEREKYESFLRSKNIHPLEGNSFTWELWQECTELKDKEIAKLRAELAEYKRNVLNSTMTYTPDGWIYSPTKEKTE